MNEVLITNLSAISTIVIAIFTVVYSIISFFMLLAINRQYKEMKATRQLSSQPFITITQNKLFACPPSVGERCWENLQIDIGTAIRYNVKVKNIGNSNALMVQGIAKLRLHDEEGNIVTIYKNWEQVDHLPIGDESTLSFVALDDDQIYLRQIIELERLQKEADGTFRYQKEIDRLSPDLDLFIKFSNLNGASFLLQAEISDAGREKRLTPIFSHWLNVIESSIVDYDKEIKLHDNTHSQEQAENLLKTLRQYVSEILDDEDDIEIRTVTHECKVSYMDKKGLAAFDNEWKSMTEEGIYCETDILKIDREATYS